MNISASAQTNRKKSSIRSSQRSWKKTRGVRKPHHGAAQGPESFGYLPKKVQQIVAEGLGLSLSEVYGVVTFYSFFSTFPKGRNSVKVCLGTACYVRGSQRALSKVEDGLGVKVGGTTEDRRYSLDVVRCIGACGLAPAILVNDDVYGRVKTTKVMEILDRYE